MKRKILPLFILILTYSFAFSQVNITFQLNTETITPDPTGIFIAGGSGFGVPGDNQLTDPDGDGIYTITIQREQGFSSFYTFTNGNCGDFSCKENLATLPCGDPFNFNDRFLPPVMSDTTILACFGLCADDGSCTAVTDSVDITIELNAETLQSVDPTGLYIAGGEGFGIPGDNELTDPDGDGIYTTVIRKPVGFTSFYSYFNGACTDFQCKENIAGLPCANPGNFNDRFLPPVMADTTIRTCWETCNSDGSCTTIATDSIDITFELNTATITPDPGGIFIAGGGNFGDPGDNPMVDPDGDGIYTITVRQPVGFTSFYTFTNGNCPDYSCKENLTGLPCGDPNNFNDRNLPPVMSDTIVRACFGTCDSDGSCTIVTDSIDITFQLNTATIEPDPSGIFIAGGGNFGDPGDNPMVDPDGDGIYTITVRKAVGFSSFYTFTNGNCGDYSCKEDLEGLECGDPNNFNDRFLPPTLSDTTILACFGNCVSDGSCSATSTYGLTVDNTLFTLRPTIVNNFTNITFGEKAINQEKQIVLMSTRGQVLFTANLQNEYIYQLNTDNYPSGMYIISVRTRKNILSKKFLIQR
jgi:hypothetical protein